MSTRFEYANVVRNISGDIMAGAGINVYLHLTTILANIYLNQNDTSYITSNPQLQSNKYGQFSFWIDSKDYNYNQLFDIAITNQGNTMTLSGISIIETNDWVTGLINGTTPAGNSIKLNDYSSSTTPNPNVIPVADNNGTLDSWLTSSAVITPLGFGAKGDGVTNDTQALTEAFGVANAIVDGGGKTYRFEGTVPATVNCRKIQNMNIVSQAPSQLLSIPAGIDFTVENCSFDGNRGNFTETWINEGTYTGIAYESSYNGIASCQPDSSNYIATTGTTSGTIRFKNCKFTNLFNADAILIQSSGVTYLENIVFSNLAFRTFEVYNTSTGNPTAYAVGIYCYNIGILPSSFLYNNGTSTSTVTYGSAGMPMPQQSYANSVVSGTYFANDIYVENYGSCAVTASYCNEAFLNNIIVINNNQYAVSNNPMGAIWNEECNYFELSNFQILITARGNDIGNGLAVMLASEGSSQIIVSDGVINITANSPLWGFELSTGGNDNYSISNVTYSDIQGIYNMGLFLNYSSTATVKSNLLVSNSSFLTTKFLIAPTQKLVLSNCDVNCSYTADIFNNETGVAGISNQQMDVKFDNCHFYNLFQTENPVNKLAISNSRFDGGINLITGPDGEILISNSILNGSFGMSASSSTTVVANMLGINGCVVSNGIAITNCMVNYINITGNTIANNNGYVINIGSNPLAGTITNNNIIIVTGTVGGSYVNSQTNLIVANNNEVTDAFSMV